MDARLSPEGFVAQKLCRNGVYRWVVTSCTEETDLQVTLKSDEEVEDWPQLVVADG